MLLVPALLAAVLLGGAAWAMEPSISWEGGLSLELPAATVAFRSELVLGWGMEPWEWEVEGVVEDGTWTELSLRGKGKLWVLEVAPSVRFDPEAPAFAGGTVSWGPSWMGVELQGIALLGEGFGWGISLRGPPDSPIETLKFRFNLKRHTDEIHLATFSPSFSFGEISFALPGGCCLAGVRGRVSFTKEGFEEVRVTLPLPVSLGCGISFGASLLFRSGETSSSAFPNLVYQGPAGVSVYFGLGWDADSLLDGIRLYGFGFYGEVGGVRFRSLTGLAEDEINLVKDPYWELLELVFGLDGCLGEGELKLAFYFGGPGPLGLGEVAVGLDLTVCSGYEVSLGLELRPSGEHDITFSWSLAL